jgi:hypothetical protein
MRSGGIGRVFRGVAAAGAVSLMLAVPLPDAFAAAPSPAAASEITRAVAKTGAASVESAHPNQFIRAFGSVLAAKKARDFASYVSAALTLRKDLAAQIVATALSAYRLKHHQADDESIIASIIEAAISANPGATASIVRAAILAYPEAKEVIIAAALKIAPDQELAILRASGDIQTISFLQSTGPATINPVNSRGIQPVNSPEQPPSGP